MKSLVAIAACVWLVQAIPSRDGLPRSFTSISTGQDYTCALSQEGTTFCWGANESGQLGIGAPDDGAHRAPIPVRTSVRFASITTGYRHACGLTMDGVAYCWGSNRYGQLGIGSVRDNPMPVSVDTSLRFATISAGATQTCAITQTHRTYCWGGNWHGQLGMGTTDGQSTEVSCCQTRPVAVVGDVIFTWISTGGIHACALTAEGVPYCWGSDQEGRFGLDTAASKDYPAPIRVHTDVRMREISVWAWHTCALSQHGVAYCWGRGVERQLGVDRPSEAQPAPMAIATSLKFAHIRVGASHSCALTEDGTLYCWGSNKFGQATGRSMDVARPEQLFADNRFAMVSLGGNDFSGHTCGLTSDGVLQCWGSDSHRQLGVYGRSER